MGNGRMASVLVVAMLFLAAAIYADSPRDNPVAAPAIETEGAIEMFAYAEGYRPAVPVASGRANISNYALHLSTDLRLARVPSLLLFEDALLLLGNSKGQEDGKRNLQPMTVLGQFGIDLQVRRQ